MKKLITIFCLLFGLIKSQPIIPITIVSINPSTVCIDDSLELCFKLDIHVPGNMPFNIQVYYWQAPQVHPGQQFNHLYTIFSGTTNDLVYHYTLDGDSIYCFKIKFPPNLPMDQWCLFGNSNYNLVYCIIVDACVGLKEYAPQSESIIYYDLNGFVTEPKPQQILIEQRGLQRRKVLFAD